VLRAAVAFADEHGIESLSMRKLGQELDVEAMSLYNHVANKEEILDGMVDLVVGEIDLPDSGADWRTAMRQRALSAREVLKRHPWAPRVIESRPDLTPTLMKYMDTTVGIFLEGGFSIDLTHHAMHAIGSRILGFTQELFDDSDGTPRNPDEEAALLRQMAASFPNISAMMKQITHDEDSVVGSGCDDEAEFVFALDLILDGLERLRLAA
jgi:AcrR family transcriptional regulator